MLQSFRTKQIHLLQLHLSNYFFPICHFSLTKKQSNSLQINLFSKLANNGKLTSNECKKHLKNNLCLYCGAKNYKLDFCLKKQTIILQQLFSKLSEKQRVTPKTLYKLRAMLNFLVQQQVRSDSMYPLFLILTPSFVSLLLLS